MSSDLGISQLDALVTLIVDSVDDFKAAFLDAGVSIPVLCAPSSAGHDMMKKMSNEKLKKATMIIEAACTQLIATVVRPELTLVNSSAKHAICACLQVTASRNIASILHNTPDGQHISELSKASGVDADSLSRVLRLLASNHIFQEVSRNVFRNNMVSAMMATSINAKEYVETRTRESFRAATYISDFLQYNNPRLSKPVSPFQLAYGLPMPEYLISPERKDAAAKFMAGVTAWAEIAMTSDISCSAFPWTDYFKRSQQIVICDVGTGEGHVLLKLAHAYPDHCFKAILQDRPAILELSKQTWKNHNSKAMQEGRVDFVPIDFVKESPVEGCDIYYIRHCIHNWPDEQSIAILKNIVKAMRSKRSSILLIHEVILPQEVGDASEENSSASDGPPAPLLKNFGAARFREYAIDISMMGLFNAKERTLDNYVSLGESAGLAFQCLWEMDGCGLMQFKLSD